MASPAQARAAVESLSAALERNDFAGWDPYDALASPVIRRLARAPVLRQVAIQGLKAAPFNLRRALAVPQTENAKGLAPFVPAYARLARLDPDSRFGELALALAERLEGHAVRMIGGVGWGYPFDVQTRWGYYRRGQPNGVVTSFAVHALMDVEPLASEGRFSALLDSALGWARSSLRVVRGGDAFYAYYQGSDTPIHNANLLVASALARYGDEDAARPALRFSLSRQRPDGSWAYGQGDNLRWVDGYHTAFVLWALHRLQSVSAERERTDAALARALDYFLSRLVDPDGAVRASPARRYPVDIHSCASSVWALADLRELDGRALRTAGRILDWTLAQMRRDDGRFAFQRRRLVRASVPYTRWSDGHMLLALSEFLAASA
jgi:hypothetical protein